MRSLIVMPSGCGLAPMGRIKPRCAKEIASNRWNISCGALDRDYTVYDTFERIGEASCRAGPGNGGPDAAERKKEKDPVAFYAFRKKGGQESLFAIWLGAQRPAHEFPMVPMQIACKGIVIRDPVLVDLLSGGVYDIPDENRVVSDAGCIFRSIPVYDSPVLIAERSIVGSQISPPGDE